VLFNSSEYLLFLPGVVCLYFLIPRRFRWTLLLVASYAFYMAWRVEYALLILVSTIVDYLAALAMARCEERRARRKWLLLSLVTNLGLLFTFKYANFASSSLNALSGVGGLGFQVPVLDVLLPVGISFYTFQTLSYSIDVYRGHQEPERHFGRFAVFVAFFPQLVAGPIERAGRLLPQFVEHHVPRWEYLRDGIRMLLLGFFKKLVIADQAALYVNPVYADPASHDGLTLAVATYLFAFQVYCDFSGYSDIAVGSARLMGFRLMENFRRPYVSQTIRELWRRWHVSLTTWFRDYVYIPLGGNRTTTVRWTLSMATVFVTSGLWHGANWTYVCWGAIHAAFVLIGTATAGVRDGASEGLPAWLRLPRIAVGVFVTFQLWCLSLIVFRAQSLTDVGTILDRLWVATTWSTATMLGGFTWTVFVAMALPAIGLFVLEVWQGERTWPEFLDRQAPPVRGLLYLSLFFSILTLGVFESQEFIYFQF
jgi:D-alanyl-lipoteichoic acid acyltransferase DltB (MBOAT superfamily)